MHTLVDNRPRSTKSPTRLTTIGLALLTPMQRKTLGASLTDDERRAIGREIEALRMKRQRARSQQRVAQIGDTIDMLAAVVYATRSIDLETLLDDAAGEDES